MYLTKSIPQKKSEEVIEKLPIGFAAIDGIAASKENKAFLSLISHNIKNPFGALLGYSELLLEDYSDLSEVERLNYTTEIKKTANLTYRYLERFFEWTYYKTGKIKPKFENINLRHLFEQVVKSVLREQCYLGEISSNIKADIEVFADSESIKKIFFYILENSIKYCNNNSFIVINSLEKEDKIIIEIIDNGIGISKSKINNLFDITKNVGHNEIGSDCGTGMGLILTKQLITLNNSTIKIESNPTFGTKVVLGIPIRRKLF